MARFDSSLESLTRWAFAAGERGRRLAELDIAEADALQRLHLRADRRHRAEEVHRLFHRHVEYIGDRLVLEGDLQRLAVVALALADVALDIDIRQEMHLDLEHAVALAGLAAPALDVEREAPRPVAARAGFGQAGEPVADRAEGGGIGRRVGARRPPDRRLVDIDDLVEMLQPVDAAMGAGHGARAVEPPGRRLVQRLDHQGGFAAARHAGHAGEHAEREHGVDLLQVVGSLRRRSQPPGRAGRRGGAPASGISIRPVM